jgi:SSS family solute:Na+ symporter
MAILLEAATGIPFAWGLALTALIVVAYTTAGGLWAVVSTDVLQGAMTVLGIVIMVPLFFSRAGGFSAVIAALPETHLQVFGSVTPWNAFGSVLTFALSMITWPSIWQRMYAAKDIPSITQSYGVFIIAFFVIVAADMGIGFAAHTLMPFFEGSENAMLPKMIMIYLPNVMGGVLLAVLMAILMGSADSLLLVSAIIIEKDLVTPFLKKNRTDRQKLVSTKIITALTGAAVLMVLYFKRDMFELWVLTSDITATTLAVPILLGFAWKRPNGKAVLASVVFSFGGWLLFTLRPDILPVSPILPGTVLSFGAYLAAAFMFPAQKRNEPECPPH